MKSQSKFVLRHSLVALAVIAAIGQARAQMSDEVKQLTTPDASVSIGVAGVSGDSRDRAQFGQYNGMREHDSYLLLDADYVTRNNDTGLWTTVVARNLGLDNREIRAGLQKQGDWKVFGEYNEITRHSPFTVNTAMQNVGSTNPTIVALSKAGTGSDYDFKTERKGATVGGEKVIMPGLKFEVSFKNEDKDGTQLWGRGYDCASYVCGSSTTAAIDQTKFLKNAILLIPNPINSNIKQIDAKLNFHTDQLSLTAAYYGSLYSNSNGSINPVVPNSLYGGNQTLVPALYPAVGTNIIAGGGMSLQNVLQSAMALPPDNEAHQFSLYGNYAITPTTKATFKYAYTRGTQNADFASAGLSGAPAGVSNLGGRVDTQAFQVGVTSRPIRDLYLVADFSYRDKKDKTPDALYNVEARTLTPSTSTTPTVYTNAGIGAIWFNNHVNEKVTNGKLEASYRLPMGFRGTVGYDYKQVERDSPESLAEENVAGLGALRGKNTEDGFRVELARSMNETLTGRVSYTQARRTGSDWTSLSTIGTPIGSTSALNTYLLNTYCGGQACYAQELPAGNIIGLSANTPFPMSLADVDTNKWRASVNWMPAERLTVQFVGQGTKETNQSPVDPVAGGKGWRDQKSDLYSIDASLALTDSWNLTGYASFGSQTIHINHSTGYMADLNNKSEAAGLSLNGRINDKLQVGAGLTYANDTNKYGVAANTGTSGDRLSGLTQTPPSAANLAQAAIGLPDVVYRKMLISAYGQYSINKTSDVRLDVGYQKSKYSDWVWGTSAALFVFGDNTSVSQKVDQSVTFVGVTYIYRFR